MAQLTWLLGGILTLAGGLTINPKLQIVYVAIMMLISNLLICLKSPFSRLISSIYWLFTLFSFFANEIVVKLVSIVFPRIPLFQSSP